MEHFATQLKNNWLFIALIFASIIWYAGVNTRLAQAEKDITDIKVALTQINEIKIQVAQVNTKVDFIKERVK